MRLLMSAAVAVVWIGAEIGDLFGDELGQAEQDDEGSSTGASDLQGAEPDDEDSSTGAGDLEVADLRIGDCFDDDPAWLEEEVEEEEVVEVVALETMPCDEPHHNEVFHQFDLAAEALPSHDEVDEEAFDTCVEVFETFVGARYEESELTFFWEWTSEDSWLEGDRSVTCYLYALDLSDLEGSAAGTAR